MTSAPGKLPSSQREQFKFILAFPFVWAFDILTHLFLFHSLYLSTITSPIGSVIMQCASQRWDDPHSLCCYNLQNSIVLVNRNLNFTLWITLSLCGFHQLNNSVQIDSFSG